MATAPNPILMQLLSRLGAGGASGGGPGAAPGNPSLLPTVQNATASPSPQGEMQTLDQIRVLIGTLVPRISMRSPKTAAKLATAMHAIDTVKKELAALPEYSVEPPPPGMPTGSPMTGGEAPQAGSSFLGG